MRTPSPRLSAGLWGTLSNLPVGPTGVKSRRASDLPAMSHSARGGNRRNRQARIGGSRWGRPPKARQLPTPCVPSRSHEQIEEYVRARGRSNRLAVQRLNTDNTVRGRSSWRGLASPRRWQPDLRLAAGPATWPDLTRPAGRGRPRREDEGPSPLGHPTSVSASARCAAGRESVRVTSRARRVQSRGRRHGRELRT